MITHWYAPDFPGWSSWFSNSQSSIFVLSLDLASLILSIKLVWVVQPTSLAGHLWVLHLSGALGLGRQIRNTICRQSQYNPCSWMTIIWLVPKLLLWNTIGSLTRNSWRLGAAGSVTSIFSPLGRSCASCFTLKWPGMPRLSQKEWSNKRVKFWIELVWMLQQVFWRPSKSTHE